MHVVGHNHRDMDPHLRAVIMEAMLQNKIASYWRQLPALMCDKGDVVFPARFFDVGKSAAVNIFSGFHSLHTAEGGCATWLFLVS